MSTPTLQMANEAPSVTRLVNGRTGQSPGLYPAPWVLFWRKGRWQLVGDKK